VADRASSEAPSAFVDKLKTLGYNKFMSKTDEYRKQYRKEHPELYREASKKWYRANRDKALNKAREYRQKNKKKLALAQKEWRKRRGKEFDKEWYAKNREKELARNRKYRLENKERLENIRILRTYGITAEKLRELKEKQNGYCAICNKRKKLYVDHCHRTNIVRGLICHKCNIAIGMVEDNTTVLDKAINYIKQEDSAK
jgi:hypothetical protein